jgi:hypothetical protein
VGQLSITTTAPTSPTAIFLSASNHLLLALMLNETTGFGAIGTGQACKKSATSSLKKAALSPSQTFSSIGFFSFSDKTKPGHRKILALFLVDPHITIISSAHVPCQQKEWRKEELREQHVFPKFPVEILKEVVDKVDEFTIEMDEAKSLELESMNERKKYVHWHDIHFQSECFS